MYSVRGYRTHEDSQHGRSERLREFGSFKEAVDFARNHTKYTKDYQTMVYNDKNKLMYAYQYGYNKCKAFSFLNEGEPFNLIKSSVSVLLDSLRKYGIVSKGWGRYEIVDIKGRVCIKEEFGSKVYVNDVVKECPSEVVGKLASLIEVLEDKLDFPVKRFVFVTDNLDRLYYTGSEDERGSIDVHLDYF